MNSSDSPNLSLYWKQNVFNDKKIPLPNILMSSWSLEDAFELWEWKDRFYPLKFDFNGNRLVIKNSHYLYHGDPHFNEISRYFDKLDSPFTYNRETPHGMSPLWYSHILNLPNTPEDVRHRQAWIRELVENIELFQAVEELFSHLEAYTLREWYNWEKDYEAFMNPIKAKKLLEKLQSFATYAENSEIFWKIWAWCEEISNDSYFQHILKEKYKIDDYHLIAFYSQRFENRVWATLKPGVTLEDFCDIIPPSWESYTETIWKWRRAKAVERHVIYEESSLDAHRDRIPFARARQRVDNIKKMAAASLSIPLFLLLTQLKQLYLWALMYKDYEKRGFPVCFPEISDNPFEFSFEELYPISWVLMFEDIDTLMPNDLTLAPTERVIWVKWPNKCWKSELLRSIHIMNMHINGWLPLPAKNARFWIVPSSKFILFQWNSYRRSQLENAKDHVFNELPDVLPSSNVILDEVWDATNQPTAAEMWDRFIYPLLEHGCRIFVTSHHDALDAVVKEVWWVLLKPQPWAEGKQRYKIIRADGSEIDYNARDTLDRIWLTKVEVKKALWDKNRLNPKRKVPQREHTNSDIDDEIPF